MVARGVELWLIVLLVWVVVIPATAIFVGMLVARRREATARSGVRLYVVRGERHSSPAEETARRMRFRRAGEPVDDASLPELVAAGRLERVR